MYKFVGKTLLAILLQIILFPCNELYLLNIILTLVVLEGGRGNLSTELAISSLIIQKVSVLSFSDFKKANHRPYLELSASFFCSLKVKIAILRG